MWAASGMGNAADGRFVLGGANGRRVATRAGGLTERVKACGENGKMSGLL